MLKYNLIEAEGQCKNVFYKKKWNWINIIEKLVDYGILKIILSEILIKE